MRTFKFIWKDKLPRHFERVPKELLDASLAFFRQNALALTTRIRNRVVVHGQYVDPKYFVARNLPAYTPKYERLRRAAGRSGHPDYIVSGNLMNHLRARTAVRGEALALVVAPYGVATPRDIDLSWLRSKAKNRRRADRFVHTQAEQAQGYFIRPAYSYVNRAGKTVQVPETRISLPPQVPGLRTEASRYDYVGKVIYNDKLAAMLGKRMGRGTWADRRVAPFIAFSGEDLRLTGREWMAFLRRRKLLSNIWKGR